MSAILNSCEWCPSPGQEILTFRLLTNGKILCRRTNVLTGPCKWPPSWRPSPPVKTKQLNFSHVIRFRGNYPGKTHIGLRLLLLQQKEHDTAEKSNNESISTYTRSKSPDWSDQSLTKQNQSHQSFKQATNVCSFEGPHSQKPHSCVELPCFPPLLNPCHTVPILEGRKNLRHKLPQRSEDFKLCRRIFQQKRPRCIFRVSTTTVTWAQRSPQIWDI